MLEEREVAKEEWLIKRRCVEIRKEETERKLKCVTKKYGK